MKLPKATVPEIAALALWGLLATSGIGAEEPADELSPIWNPAWPGFREVVVSVGDLEASIELYRTIAGWEVAHRGPAADGQAAAWGLDPDVPIQEALLRNPGAEGGFLRLVRFEGLPQEVIRSSAQSWDTGGFFDFNVRVANARAKFRQLQDLGWHAYSDPQEFSFGKFVVREVLIRGPDEVVLAMIERVAPPLEGWPHLRELSRIFNATQVVRDFDRSFDFYTRVLGFRVYLEHAGASKQPGPNVLGIPHNLTAELPRKVAILSPDGRNSGSIEILSFEGLEGADHSPRAVPPNRGILMVRYLVADLERLRRRLNEHSVAPLGVGKEIVVRPYGTVRTLSLQAPEGAWMEFLEPLRRDE